MKITIGRFEFDGSIGLRGWRFFVRIPRVCEAYSTSNRRGPAMFE